MISATICRSVKSRDSSKESVLSTISVNQLHATEMNITYTYMYNTSAAHSVNVLPMSYTCNIRNGENNIIGIIFVVHTIIIMYTIVTKHETLCT